MRYVVGISFERAVKSLKPVHKIARREKGFSGF